MIFNSLEFALFFPIVTVGYFLLPHRYRWQWLLLASCYFYMAFIPIYILILFFTIGVDFAVGVNLARLKDPPARKILLITSLVANVGVLAIFKYYGFLDSNLEAISRAIGWNYSLPALGLILPVGLSFHTFQSMSYIIEVYRGHQPAERHLGIFALYVMYYPQLVAGPIERPQQLLHQFREPHTFDYGRVRSGLQQMLWGLFKKVAIADQLATSVDIVFSRPGGFQGLHLIAATVMFAVQIYCDFSGYSDIAIGASRVMGIELMENFRQPYWSKSISEFWRRWHISLSTWFRDYLYIPLGGNRVPPGRRLLNLFIVFVVSGLWHGASWGFIIWGALHGFYLIFGILTRPVRDRVASLSGLQRLPRLMTGVRVLTTFSLVCFAWIFFRANTLADAAYIATHLTTGLAADIRSVASLGGMIAFLNSLAVSKFTLLAILMMEVGHRVEQSHNLFNWVSTKPILLRWTLYYAAAIAIVVRFSAESKQFIYFQF